MLKVLLLYLLMIPHPMHVTLTSINQVQGNDTLKVFFRMYYDDFLKDYKLNNPDFTFKKKAEDIIIPDDLLKEYFDDMVQIYINRKLLTGRLLAVSNDNIEISLSLIYVSYKEPEQFKIRNKVMTKLYSDQTNMVFISINNYEEALKLTPKHSMESCTLN